MGNVPFDFREGTARPRFQLPPMYPYSVSEERWKWPWTHDYYYKSNKALNWVYAQEECNKMGGNLARIDSQAKIDMIKWLTYRMEK